MNEIKLTDRIPEEKPKLRLSPEAIKTTLGATFLVAAAVAVLLSPTLFSTFTIAVMLVTWLLTQK